MTLLSPQIGSCLLLYISGRTPEITLTHIFFAPLQKFQNGTLTTANAQGSKFDSVLGMTVTRSLAPDPQSQGQITDNWLYY